MQPKFSNSRNPTGRWIVPLVLAGVATMLAAFKPLNIDDVYYYKYARAIAAAPLDPYGFELDCWQWDQPAIRSLAPPVFVYWLAAAVRLAPDQPVLWKLWLFPVLCLLAFALTALGDRFARGVETPLVVLVFLSPFFLPNVNLMTDVAVLSLSLASLAMFRRSSSRRSWPAALVAGVVLALAMETKYTGFITAGVVMLYAVVFGRLGFGLISVGLAVVLFAGWEGLVAAKYGPSHFLLQFTVQGARHEARWPLVESLWMTVGATGAGLGLAGLAALRAPHWLAASAAGATIAGYLAVFAGFAPEPVYQLFGAGVWCILLVIVCRLCLGRKRFPRTERFLVGWLALELVGYFALSPFPATRRLLGVFTVAAILVARLASCTSRSGTGRRWLWGAAIANALIGICFYGIDVQSAWLQKKLAHTAAEFVRGRQPDSTVWFEGFWGWQFYAEREGMRLIRPDELPIHEGDWLVTTSTYGYQVYTAPDDALEKVADIALERPLALSTFPGYYTGVVPMQASRGPVTATIHRVRRDFLPRTPLELFARLIMHLYPPPPTASAVLRNALAHPDARTRLLAVKALAVLGPDPAAEEPLRTLAAGDPYPQIRDEARRLLALWRPVQ